MNPSFSSGEDESGEVVTIVGNGWRIFVGIFVLADEGARVALLLLLFLYCVILLWKVESTGDDNGEENFPRSSAERDHPLRDMFRRSPRPPPPGGEEWVGEGKECEMSSEPGGRDDRSRTDLNVYESVLSKHYDVEPAAAVVAAFRNHSIQLGI